jgi:hypothetical protein
MVSQASVSYGVVVQFIAGDLILPPEGYWIYSLA